MIGKCIEFSPAVINQHLGRNTDEVVELEVNQNDICKTLTGNVVKAWPKKHNLPATKLTGLARFIYVVGARTPFDFGAYIYYEIIMHGKSHVVKMPIAFPTLICDIILAQYPGIFTEADVPSKRESDLSLDFRLFEGTHVADIVAPSVKQPTGVFVYEANDC
jgi:hypothetical protein